MKSELVVDGEGRLLNRPFAAALTNHRQAMRRAMRRPLAAVIWTMVVLVGACVLFVMAPLDLPFIVPFATVMAVIALCAALFGVAHVAGKRAGRRYVIRCGACGAPVLDPVADDAYRHALETGNCRACDARVLEAQSS